MAFECFRQKSSGSALIVYATHWIFLPNPKLFRESRWWSPEKRLIDCARATPYSSGKNVLKRLIIGFIGGDLVSIVVWIFPSKLTDSRSCAVHWRPWTFFGRVCWKTFSAHPPGRPRRGRSSPRGLERSLWRRQSSSRRWFRTSCGRACEILALRSPRGRWSTLKEIHVWCTRANKDLSNYKIRGNQF